MFHNSLYMMKGTVLGLALLSLIVVTVATEPATEDEDYIDLFGSTTPGPVDEGTTTPPPFWTSENEYDQVDMVLKREIFALFKMVYPAVLLVAAGITILCLLVPVLILLSIVQHNTTRIVTEIEKETEGEDVKEKKPQSVQQPLESSPEWQKILPSDED